MLILFMFYNPKIYVDKDKSVKRLNTIKKLRSIKDRKHKNFLSKKNFLLKVKRIHHCFRASLLEMLTVVTTKVYGTPAWRKCVNVNCIPPALSSSFASRLRDALKG